MDQLIIQFAARRNQKLLCAERKMNAYCLMRYYPKEIFKDGRARTVSEFFASK